MCVKEPSAKTCLNGQSATPCRIDHRDVDLLHGHHCVEGALGFAAASGHGFGQGAGGNLPGNAPFILAPATVAFLPAIADDGIPVAVGFCLIVGGDLEGECFRMWSARSTI